jgi:hypothetical protein
MRENEAGDDNQWIFTKQPFTESLLAAGKYAGVEGRRLALA